MNPREGALIVLYEVNENGAYSNIALNKELRNNTYNQLDKNLLTELVYGVLENQIYIDYVIGQFSTFDIKKMNIYTLNLLRLGIYQLLFLDKVPSFAAVNETVNLSKKYCKKTTGFINGVLRNVQRNIKNIKLPNPDKNMTKYFCELLGVSRSGYYNYIKSSEVRKAKDKADLEVRDIILKAFNRRGYKKGSRSIKMILENEFEIQFSRKRIRRIMRKFNIVCPHRKSNPYRKIAKATKEHHVVANKLNRQFKQNTPGKVLLTDITYLPYGKNNMAYLSTIKDASTNEILAYHVSERITLDIATNTIHKLMKNKKNILHKDAFIHSDQGSHYTSPRYQKILKEYGLDQSMSRRGNCWDNAPQESFFGHFKDEVNYKSCKTLKEIESRINHYMVYYNNYRYQWNLKKMTPIQYRNHLLAA